MTRRCLTSHFYLLSMCCLTELILSRITRRRDLSRNLWLLITLILSKALLSTQMPPLVRIEVLFENLKSRGFNFEDTHLKDPSRIKKMLGLLTVATCWAQKTGDWEEAKKATKIKTHGRRALSIFRRGLDKLRTVFYNINDSFEAFYELLALFPPPSRTFLKLIKSPLASII